MSRIAKWSRVEKWRQEMWCETWGSQKPLWRVFDTLRDIQEGKHAKLNIINRAPHEQWALQFIHKVFIRSTNVMLIYLVSFRYALILHGLRFKAVNPAGKVMVACGNQNRQYYGLWRDKPREMLVIAVLFWWLSCRLQWWGCCHVSLLSRMWC